MLAGAVFRCREKREKMWSVSAKIAAETILGPVGRLELYVQETLPEPRPEASICRYILLGRRGRVSVFRRSVMTVFFDALLGNRISNFLPRLVTRPKDLIIPDPVVGSARVVPISDRRVQRDCLPIKNHFPIGGSQRSEYFSTAPTAAFVKNGPIRDRHVKDAVFQGFRNELDELNGRVLSLSSWFTLIE